MSPVLFPAASQDSGASKRGLIALGLPWFQLCPSFGSSGALLDRVSRRSLWAGSWGVP